MRQPKEVNTIESNELQLSPRRPALRPGGRPFPAWLPAFRAVIAGGVVELESVRRALSSGRVDRRLRRGVAAVEVAW